MFAKEIKRRRIDGMRQYPQWRWHVDEVFVKINGVRHYLWTVGSRFPNTPS
jgi:putative transposase